MGNASLQAAIYARVSTDEQAQSVETQEADGRRFCESRGWAVASVYRDEGVSGANFTTRPALLHLLLDAEHPSRAWDVLVVRDLDRIGRDQAHTIIAVQKIIEADARIYTYSNAEEVRLDPMQKVMLGVRAAFAEYERAMIVGRVRGALEHRARRGLATGGAVFGYRNIRRGDGLADFEVDERQAATVREIFELRDAGVGVRSIVGALNAKGIAPPRAGRRGTGSWSPSVVWAILRRERYRGVIVWGAVRKGYKAGKKVRTPQATAELVRVERPDLRIIDDDLWHRAQASSHLGHVRSGRAPRHLLSGFARCARCGGPMVTSSKRHGKVDIKTYLCAWARDRGPTVCTSSLRRPVEELDDAITAWLREHVLDDSFVGEVLGTVRRQMEALATAPDPREALESELRRTEIEIERLGDAIARCDAGVPDALVRKVNERHARARELRTQIHSTRADLPSPARWEAIEADARERLADLREMFGRCLAESRNVLAALLTEPLRCAIVDVDGRRRFRLTGYATLPTTIDLIAGGKVNPIASPEGSERHDLPPKPGVPIDVLADNRKAA